MQPKILLRIAAAASAFIALGHTFGAMLAAVSHGPEEDALLKALATFTFDIAGSTRSHWDFYRGEGWYLSLTMVTFTIVLWSLSNAVAESPALVRRLAFVSTLFFAVATALCARYFFIAPLACSAIATIACGVAWLRLGTSLENSSAAKPG
jgi:uncharacterized membrane protein